MAKNDRRDFSRRTAALTGGALAASGAARGAPLTIPSSNQEPGRIIEESGYGLPSKTIKEMIVGSVDVIVQAARLRDGSRRITHITEVVGLEGDVIVTQDLFVYEITGEDADGKVIGKHRSTGIARPRFWDRARYYGLERELAEALDAAE